MRRKTIRWERALLFQDENYLEKAEILREKGTNRSKFFRGQIDKYTWIDYGSSYLPSDMNAAYLLAELEEHEKIDRKRMAIYNYYHEQLRSTIIIIQISRILRMRASSSVRLCRKAVYIMHICTSSRQEIWKCVQN